VKRVNILGNERDKNVRLPEHLTTGGHARHFQKVNTGWPPSINTKLEAMGGGLHGSCTMFMRMLVIGG
jgi:hypothetical protein